MRGFSGSATEQKYQYRCARIAGDRGNEMNNALLRGTNLKLHSSASYSSPSNIDTSHVTIEHRNIEMDGYAEHGRVGDACEVYDEISEVIVVIRIR
ncbi:hypothetical protein LguiA_008154 [Lonicera macranthoides]